MDDTVDAAFDPPPLPLDYSAPISDRFDDRDLTWLRTDDQIIAAWPPPEHGDHVAITVPRSRRYRLSKRALDITVAAIALVLTAPLILLLALAVRLDSPGPAFFRQRRVGERGRVFRIIKLRSMTGDDRSIFPGPGDQERVTRVGRFLRRWSLDELPQLVNVLRGDMSLVGPRPERLDIVLQHYQPWQYQRFLVPQGMTGWWQVTGRGTTILLEQIDDDLDYIARASFGLDLRILWLTLPAVVRQARRAPAPSLGFDQDRGLGLTRCCDCPTGPGPCEQ